MLAALLAPLCCVIAAASIVTYPRVSMLDAICGTRLVRR
jgi:hypothetical protein